MLNWISANIGAIIICAVLAAIVIAIIANMIRKKRRGQSMVCNCGSCKACPMSGACHKQ